MIVKRIRRWAGLEEAAKPRRPAPPGDTPPPVRVLMVCTGNICRSPTAEGVLRAKLQRLGLHGRVEVDSAGTHGYHTGEPPDPRAIRHAAQRGYDISRLKARPVTDEDFARFDWVLAMDETHLLWLRKRQPPDTPARTDLLMAYARHHADVPESPTRTTGGRPDSTACSTWSKTPARAWRPTWLAKPPGEGPE
jgi:protein-tyrosine phosphatase